MLQYLEMWAGDALGELFKQWRHHLLELCRLNHIQDFLQFIQVHHLHIIDVSKTRTKQR